MKESYKIYKNVFEINDEILFDLDSQVSKNGSKIFNGIKKNDNKRIQSTIRTNKKNKELVKGLYDFVSEINPELKPSKFVIIKSKINCEKQMAHLDYEYNDELKNIENDEDVPLLVLVALMPNTSMYIWDKISETLSAEISPIKIELDKGDILVFRADTIHAGSDYLAENIRMHCYLDSEKINRKKNRTWIVNKHGETVIKAMIRE